MINISVVDQEVEGEPGMDAGRGGGRVACARREGPDHRGGARESGRCAKVSLSGALLIIRKGN